MTLRPFMKHVTDQNGFTDVRESALGQERTLEKLLYTSGAKCN